MNNWAPVFSGLVDSSIWEEEDHVFRVFMALMSLKDMNHVVSMDGYQLAKRIHMSVEKVTDALRVLAAPDKRRPGQEFEGRRIERVEDGWLVLKGEYYRAKVSKQNRLESNRRAQATFRQKRKEGKVPRGTPSPGEAAYVKAVEAGDERAADAAIESYAEDCGVKMPERHPLASPMSISSSTSEGAKRDKPPSAPAGNGAIPFETPGMGGTLYPIPEVGSGPVYPVQEESSPPEPPVESGRFVDGEWVPD